MIGLQYAWRSVLAGRLLLLFLLVTLIPAGALILLGLRLASQDRGLLGRPTTGSTARTDAEYGPPSKSGICERDAVLGVTANSNTRSGPTSAAP
jgi:hypothetical protein